MFSMNRHQGAFAVVAAGLMLSSVATSPSVHAAAAAYPTNILASSPAAYFRMNESSGTTAANEVNALQTGTYSGATLGVAGVRPSPFDGLELTNTAAQFTYAGFVDNGRFEATTLSLNDATYSLEYWINATSVGPTDGTQYLGGRGDAFGYDTIGLSNDGAGNGQIFFFNGVNSPIFDPAVFTSNAWHQLVFTRNNNAIAVYLDGALRFAADNANSAITYTLATNPDRIVAGARPNNIATFGGRIDELSVYDVTLSTQQVADHYAAAFVPEPTTIAMLSLGGLYMLRTRRR